MNCLAIDCGATSCRAVLGAADAGRLTTEEVYRFPTPRHSGEGRLYWDVQAIYGHILDCLAMLRQRGLRIDSIGIDTWGVDFGLLDASGNLLAPPRSYRDPYTDGVPEQVFRLIPRQELYAITGIQTMPFNTVFQLYALRAEDPALMSRARRLLFMPDLLAYMLTGRAVCEYTIASTSGLLNARTRQFDASILQRLGIDRDLFLPVTAPGTVVGTLRPEVAQSTGVGEVPVVAVAGHDTASAVATVPAGPVAYLSSGTWSLMGINLPQPVLSPQAATQNFTNEGGLDGTVRFLKNITGLWLVEQCREVWRTQGHDYSYADLTTLAAQAADYPGRINPDDPRFAHPADMDAAIRAALAQRACPPPAGHAEVLSCIYHSLADRYAEVLCTLRRFSPFAIERLHIIGGGSANALLNRWTEQAVGIPVVAGPTEATALGNLQVQMSASRQH